MLTDFSDLNVNEKYKKEELKRLHIKVDKELYLLIEQYAKQKKYLSRSEAIRDMIRRCLKQDKFIK